MYIPEGFTYRDLLEEFLYSTMVVGNRPEAEIIVRTEFELLTGLTMACEVSEINIKRMSLLDILDNSMDSHNFCDFVRLYYWVAPLKIIDVFVEAYGETLDTHRIMSNFLKADWSKVYHPWVEIDSDVAHVLKQWMGCKYPAFPGKYGKFQQRLIKAAQRTPF